MIHDSINSIKCGKQKLEILKFKYLNIIQSFIKYYTNIKNRKIKSL